MMGKRRSAETYRKLFTRNFSLANIEIWYRAESRNEKQWTNKLQPHQPYIVFEKKNDQTSVYYSEKGIDWMRKEITRRIRENRRFLNTIRENIVRKIRSLEKIYKNLKVLNYRQLVGFLRDFEDAYPWMEAMWFIGTVAETKDIDVRLLTGIRKRTNILAPYTELVIRKSIRKCFPEYRGFEDVISGKEIRTRSIPPLDELKKRKKQYVFTDGKLFLRSRKYVEDKYNIRIKEDIVGNTDVLEGKTAYGGKVRGIAKIITGFQDVRSFKKDEILVAPETMPDIMPAIRKAKAIVTDEGGSLSHASIVSRELGIPCVIGTKIATKVLRDGQMVEVDADKGVVKIIK